MKRKKAFCLFTYCWRLQKKSISSSTREINRSRTQDADAKDHKRIGFKKKKKKKSFKVMQGQLENSQCKRLPSLVEAIELTW